MGSSEKRRVPVVMPAHAILNYIVVDDADYRRMIALDWKQDQDGNFYAWHHNAEGFREQITLPEFLGIEGPVRHRDGHTFNWSRANLERVEVAG